MRFRCLPQRSLEALDRLTKAFGAETESLMMDRHDEMSAAFIGHLHGLFRNGSGQCANRGGTVEPDRHQVCNTRNLLARTHNPAAAKMRSRGCGSSEPDLVVTASDQRVDAVPTATVTMRVRSIAPHHLHHWVRFRRRKRIGAVRWQSGRRGHTDRANEDRRKNVAHLVTPFGPIGPGP